ncbi:PH domain-containing protein [Microbacterium dextranolyticum]|uniref:PH domain-containing protein n=1 Tax=Microbacterium dextranolyticum TaxID=36806 RepID=A0A9W6M686_9MICO|nr:PH domain-containing protein [Microbacterium dextranolyticum]MBM7463298.1 hypothetical protein [Microbacterium dextranolyticum]GLJ95597.1 hypothetical protein GCM10017591_16600 [Microbacterium dextranolyticum]
MTEDVRGYRSMTNTVIAIGLWIGVAAGATLVAILGATTSTDHLWALIPLALAAVLVRELFWRPRIQWDDEAITLVNPFATTIVPWTMVVDIDTRFALTIVTPARRYRSSAAPAAGAVTMPHGGRDSLGPDQRDGVIRKSAALGTDSGDAAYIVRAVWNDLVEKERIPLGRAASDRARTRVHAGIIALTVLLAAATVPALLNF